MTTDFYNYLLSLIYINFANFSILLYVTAYNGIIYFYIFKNLNLLLFINNIIIFYQIISHKRQHDNVRSRQRNNSQRIIPGAHFDAVSPFLREAHPNAAASRQGPGVCERGCDWRCATERFIRTRAEADLWVPATDWYISYIKNKYLLI